MNIAYKLMSGKPVEDSEIKYLLWMALCELERKTNEETVGEFDEEECFNIDDMLGYLGREFEFDNGNDCPDESFMLD